jgi:hypothetical protein
LKIKDWKAQKRQYDKLLHWKKNYLDVRIHQAKQDTYEKYQKQMKLMQQRQRYQESKKSPNNIAKS